MQHEMEAGLIETSRAHRSGIGGPWEVGHRACNLEDWVMAHNGESHETANRKLNGDWNYTYRFYKQIMHMPETACHDRTRSYHHDLGNCSL